MVWTSGLQLLGGPFYSGGGNSRRFAEQINTLIMAVRGNKIISGCDPSVGVQSNLPTSGDHLDVDPGRVLVAGVNLEFVGGSVDLSSAHNALTAGEARYVLITIYNNGGTATLRATSGSIANDENQEPPESPQDEVDICLIYLEEATVTMTSSLIGQWIIPVEQGVQLNDDKILYFGNDGDIQVSWDNANGWLQLGDGVNDFLRIQDDGGTGIFTFLGTITATSYGGITESNLLDKSDIETISGLYTFSNQSSVIGGITASNLVDKSAIETIAGAWTFSDSSSIFAGVTGTNLLDKTSDETITGAWIINNATGLTFNNRGSGGDPILLSDNAGQILGLTGGMIISGALTALSYGGITEANLVNKSALETITNTWTFDSAGGVVIENQLAGANPSLTSNHATLQQMLLTGELNISSIVAGDTDYDKFLVSHGGRLKYRTGSQVASDIGALASIAHADLSDVAMTGPQLEDITSFASGNTSFMPCNTLIWTNGAFTNTVTRTIANVNGGNNYVMFGLPLETNRGSLKLYVKDIRVILDDANGSNFISSTTIIGVTGVTDVEIDADPTNYTTGGVHTFERSATDVSQYLTINIQLWNNTASSNLLEIFSLQVEYYYE